MNKNIKLYIDGQLTDCQDKSISYAITKQISDFTDITQRTGSFSYSINLPRSTNNKKIFGFIDELDVINKFKRNSNYDCQLQVNDNTLIDGLFVLREITSTSFQGNIVNRFGDVFSLIGDKLITELKLPIIDFEGVMLPVTNDSTPNTYSYNTLSSNSLNPSLGYDMFALATAYKDPTRGLLGASLDLRDYYVTSFVQYSNFFVSSSKNVLQLNTFINDFSIYNYMPQIKLLAVIKQLFTDIGYSFEIKNELVADPNLVIPYFGDSEPLFNWLHLSKCSIFTDRDNISFSEKKNTNTAGVMFGFGTYTDNKPFVSSKEASKKSIHISTGKQFSDQKGLGADPNTVKQMNTQVTANSSDDFKVHYTPTNGLNYDFNNNFSSFTPAAQTGDGRDGGWIYTAPADGTYNFNLVYEHDISFYHWRRFGTIETSYYPKTTTFLNKDDMGFPLWTWDELKVNYGNFINGYIGDPNNLNGHNPLGPASWNYNNKEQFEMGNMVIFYKGSDDLSNQSSPLLSAYIDTFDSNYLNNAQGVGQHVERLQQAKKLANLADENVIAFYNPMLRDLYNGGRPDLRWEDWIVDQKTLYKNTQAYPITEEDKLNYYGFGNGTDILNYDNQLASAFWDMGGYGGIGPRWRTWNTGDTVAQTSAEQKKYKLVKAYLSPEPAYQLDNETPSYRNTWYPTYPAKAGGTIKFEFNTKLAKGEQVRMYYVTASQWRIMNNLVNYNSGPDAGNMYQDSAFWDGEGHGQKYSDWYFDDGSITSLNIKCISDDAYTESLPLANFLPTGIKQKDLLNDFIKSNNLFFDIEGNNVIFNTRKDFYSNTVQKDLTDRMNNTYDNIQPIVLNRSYTLGTTSPANYDFSAYLQDSNPTIKIDLGNNIYLDQTVVDLTSTIFKNTYARPSFYRAYNISWQGGFYTSNTNYQLFSGIDVPSFQEGGDFRQPLSEADANYSRAKRLLYYDGFLTSVNLGSKLINGIPFNYVPINISSVDKGLLNNQNKATLFNDKFLDLQDSSYIEWYGYIDDALFANLKLNRPIKIMNTIYYIQQIQQYNPLNIGMTKLVLLKL